MKNYYTILKEKLQEISELSSGKINTYEYLTGEEISPSNQRQILEQAKFTYSSLGKAFENQTKTIEDQERKEVDISKTLKPKQLEAIEDKSDDNEKNLKHKEVFSELSNEIIGQIYSISKEISFNNFTYHFKGSNTPPINFIEFRDPVRIYNEIKNGNISIQKSEEDQKLFKSKLN